MPEYHVISADSHVLEPQDLWLTHMPSAFKSRAPRVEPGDDADYYIVEGLTPTSMMAMSNAGQSSKELRKSSRYDEVLRGGWDPEARLVDMQRDGVDAEVVYPSLGMRMQQLEDLPFLHACNEAYNDWAADFAGAKPDRIKAIGLIVADDIEWAVKETHRVADKGLAGIMTPATTLPGKEHYTRHHDPLWAAAEERGLPVSLHIIAGRRVEFQTDRYWASYATLPHIIAETITELIFSGVFERYPKLRVVSAEVDASWMANVMERLDHFYGRYRHSRNEHLAGDLMPSDVFKEHVYATFIRDRAAVKLLDLIGSDRVMWSSDYPHSDSTWPNSQAVLDDHFKDAPAEHRRKVTCENAAKLYGFV